MINNGRMMRMHMMRWASWSAAEETEMDETAIGDLSSRRRRSAPDAIRASDAAPEPNGSKDEPWNDRPERLSTEVEQATNWRRASDGSDGLSQVEKENQTTHLVRPSPELRQNRPSPLAAANSHWISSSPRHFFTPGLENVHKAISTPPSALDEKPKRFDSSNSMLFTLEEITPSSSSEEILPMSSMDEKSAVQNEPTVRVESALLRKEPTVTNPFKWSDPGNRLHIAYQSLSSPSKVEVPSQKEERKCLNGTISTTDSFELAYAVWRRKGLLPENTSLKSKSIGFSGPQKCSTVRQDSQDSSQSIAKKKGTTDVGFISPCSKTIKPWNCDQKSFSNILGKWKSQTDKQPFSSPGSCTVIQVHHVNDKSKSSRNALYSGERNETHPSSSLSIAAQKLSHHDESPPTRSSPRSQAWKLKTARDLRVLQEKHVKREEGRNDFTEPILPKTSAQFNDRSKSQPRGLLRQTIFGPIHRNIACQPPSSQPVTDAVEPKTYKRAQSQPRSVRRSTIATCENRGIDSITEIEPRRVCDLAIEETQDEIFDVPIQISCVPLEEKFSNSMNSLGEDSDSELFSPYSKRVMRNLAKVYDESDDLKTPRRSDSHHPWQHDRLLQRVDSLVENLSGEFPCRCSNAHSIFSGSDDMVEFFLPLMGSSCSCGSQPPGLILPEQPTSLVNILRPWQVSFLGRFGIYFGEELVKSFHRSGAALAKALQQYRKKEGMTPFPLKSCIMALQIWSKTSKTFVRSIRDQLSQFELIESIDGATLAKDATLKLKVPNTLYLLSSFMEKLPIDNLLVQVSKKSCSRNTGGSMLRSLDPVTSPL